MYTNCSSVKKEFLFTESLTTIACDLFRMMQNFFVNRNYNGQNWCYVHGWSTIMMGICSGYNTQTEQDTRHVTFTQCVLHGLVLFVKARPPNLSKMFCVVVKLLIIFEVLAQIPKCFKHNAVE
jgi:hypothetical protein